MSARACAGSSASAASVLGRLARIGAPPWPRFWLAVGLGVAGAMATVGLLAGSGYVVDKAAMRPGLGAIAGLLAAVEVLAFLRGPLRYGERLVGHDAAFRSLTRWRVWLYDRLEPLAPGALAGWRSGDLLTRATDDVDTLQDLYLRCLLPVSVTTGAGALAVVVTALILPAAGVVLGAALAVAVVGVPALALAGAPTRGREAALRGELSAEVVDLLAAAPDLIAYGAQGALLERVEAANAELARLARRRAWVSGGASALVSVCVGAAVVGTLATGIDAVRAHHLSAVLLGVLPLAALGAFETVPALAQAAVRAADVVAAGRRLLALADVAVPVVDPAAPDELPAGCPAIEVTGARLRYAPDLPWVLDGVDLHVEPGAHVGVVGSSGAGKSSLVHALVRFWPLQGGSARLGGTDLERLAQSDVRRAVGLVDQDAHVFAGTVRANVTLGRPKAAADEVAEAVRLAHLDTWVATLPDGLDTQVGEGGAQVSGGERHRIALARALLYGSPVLLLDEPTAGVGHEAGLRLVAEVLDAAKATGRSVVLVTHRLAELEGFDAVVVLDNERGAD